MVKKILPVYLFPGPEIARKRDRIKSITHQLTEVSGHAPELHRFYPYETSVADIMAVLRNKSLFSARRLILIADVHAFKSADIKVFNAYIAQPSLESVLIFTTDYIPGTREYPRSLADKLPKNAIEVFWEMFEHDKRGWVLQFFREKNIRVATEAVELLLDITEGTTDALREACERLSFSVNTDEILDENSVDAALEHGREETIYSLFHRFCLRDLSRVLEAYHAMIHSDTGIVDRILMMLADPLMRLLDFHQRVSRGILEDVAAREIQLRGGKRALRSYIEGARNFSGAELQNAVQRLVDLEAWLRTAPRELRVPKIELWFCRTLGP